MVKLIRSKSCSKVISSYCIHSKSLPDSEDNEQTKIICLCPDFCDYQLPVDSRCNYCKTLKPKLEKERS